LNHLNQTEEQTFNAEIAKIEPKDREKVMAITTSWEEKGIEEGRRLESIESTLEVLEHKLTEISSSIEPKNSKLI
jgi:hypothetical protein